jgi:hypothetical protein
VEQTNDDYPNGKELIFKALGMIIAICPPKLN